MQDFYSGRRAETKIYFKNVKKSRKLLYLHSLVHIVGLTHWLEHFCLL